MGLRGFYGGFYGYPYFQYPGYGGYPAYGGYWDASADLRVQVTPRTAEVYVDGYLVGNVDDFDGTLSARAHAARRARRLGLPGGIPHHQSADAVPSVDVVQDKRNDAGIARRPDGAAACTAPRQQSQEPPQQGRAPMYPADRPPY